MFVTSTPMASIRSPQSPGWSNVENESAMALLQQPATVELVVDDVDVVVLVDGGVDAVVLDVELVDVELVDDVVGPGEVVDVVVGGSVVEVLPGPPAQEPGGGALVRLRSVSVFATVVPPNDAQ